MSEFAPTPEVTNKPEALSPRDEVDAIRDERAALAERIASVEGKPSIGFAADTQARIDAENTKNEVLRESEPRLQELNEMWIANGGEEIDRAQAAYDEASAAAEVEPGQRLRAVEKNRLRFAEAQLRDAKDAFYANTHPESAETESTAETDPVAEDIKAIAAMAKENPEIAAHYRLEEHLQNIMRQLDEALDQKSTLDTSWFDDDDKDEKTPDFSWIDDDKETPEKQPDFSWIDDDESKKALAGAGLSETVEKREEERAAELNNDGKHNEAEGDQKDLTAELSNGGLNEAEEDRKQYEADQRDLAAERNANKPKWWRHPLVRLSGKMNDARYELNKRKKDKESDKESMSKRKKILIGIAGAAAVAGVYLGMKYGLDWDNGSGTNSTPDHTSDIPEKVTPWDNNPATPDVSEFTKDASTIHNGEGWLNQLKDMGFSDKEAQDKLEKILNSDDPGIKEWTYRMSDGNPGLAHPGTMSQSVLESVKNL